VANVFISYARRDRERVLTLASALEREGLSVWWDPNLVPGKRFRDIIARELSAADSVVVVWTAASIQSDYVQDEAEEARERGVLVPITLELVKPPAGFRQVQAADLTQWTGSNQHPEFRMLLTAVRTLVEAARLAEAEESAQPTAQQGAAPVPAEPPAAAWSASAPASGPSPLSTPVSTPVSMPAPQEGPRPELAFLPRLFDAFARPAVWLSAAAIVVLSGVNVGFGLSGVAGAMVLWAGAMAQACLQMPPARKTTVMLVSLGVAMIVGASAHSPKGVVTAALVGGAVFAGIATVMIAPRGGPRRRDPAARKAYRQYWEKKILSDLGDERWRERRRRRAKSDAAGDG
jgi:TIR domain